MNQFEAKMEERGWFLTSTGGGCTAYYKKLRDEPDDYMLMTSDLTFDNHPTSPTEQVTIGIYSDSVEICSFTCWAGMIVDDVIKFQTFEEEGMATSGPINPLAICQECGNEKDWLGGVGVMATFADCRYCESRK